MSDRNSSGKDGKGSKPNKLDLAELRRLVTLMESKDLAEVEIEQEGKRVRVVRTPAGFAATEAAQASAPAGPAPAPAEASAPVEAAAGGPPTLEIPSPMVGTFYRAPSPDTAPYCEVGDRIQKDTVVCIVEAMKVMNEITADVGGTILEILVQNGEPVEFGQPLFVVAQG